jgi:hypothetical protein
VSHPRVHPRKRVHTSVNTARTSACATIFVADEAALRARVVRALRRMPPLSGDPIRIGRMSNMRSNYGPSHAGTMLRKRRIFFNCTAAEFPRIFVHEVFHFVWLRGGNVVRISFEQLLADEIEGGVQGELGWSAELRKEKLTAADRRHRTRRWREYCCEAFCDTAAWLYCGLERHEEFTLAKRCRKIRREWFKGTFGGRQLPI